MQQLVHIPNRHFIKTSSSTVSSHQLYRLDLLYPQRQLPSHVMMPTYAAGYVCRKIHKSIHRSSKPDQAELLRCVKALDDDEEAASLSAASLSAAWVNEVDRGGLWHVREGTYMLFVAEVREHFRFGASKERCRERLTTALSSNDEVLFHWCMLTAEIEEIHAQTVLDMLVSLWVTIRGFSFASAFIEMYKQEKNQRSKALRKDIRPDFAIRHIIM